MGEKEGTFYDRACLCHLPQTTMPDRRDLVPFDPRFFERERAAGKVRSLDETFADIHRAHHWQGSASPSGAGAAREQTTTIEREIPDLLRRLGATSLLDAPCGDFSWMQHVDLTGISYTGADIVPEIVAENAARYGAPGRTFVQLDLTRDPLPRADVLLCRDALVHLSFADIRRVLRNVRASGTAYLLTTTFPGHAVNEDIVSGDWRLLNLEHAPFAFPPPRALIVEGCTEGGGRFADKSLALWRVEDL